MRCVLSIAVLATAASGLLAGCSGTVEDTLDSVLPKQEATYKSSRSLPPLEIPPDLSASTLNDSLKVPEGGAGSATYSEYSSASQQVAAVGATAGVLPDLSNVRVERSGDERWLVVQAPPAQIWPKLRDFWLEQGFLIEVEDPRIGIMETDWAETRASIKGGFIQGLMSKMSTAFQGMSTRDKFRTRLERGSEPGVTEIFISHRGAQEVTLDSPNNTAEDERSRSWQPRPSDPELEAEMLARMMVFFGSTDEAARETVAAAPARPERARMERDGGGSVLTVDETFSRAWRRTGLALDRVGFTVQDRDRSRGLYFVRYVDPDKDVKSEDDSGFMSKLAFWKDDTRDTSADQYLINLVGGRDGQDTTQVMVLDNDGQRDVSATADRILGLLHEQLK